VPGPANLYGVANPLPLPVFAGMIGATDIVCPAGAETNVIALPTNVPISQGIYYPAVSGVLWVTLGATPASQVTVGARIGAGADFFANAYNTIPLVASATIMIPFFGYGPSALLSYPTGPLTINISINPGAQAVTARAAGALAYGWWQRAPDQ
jgi:hypothetical protein